jgi:hypothetical protein
MLAIKLHQLSLSPNVRDSNKALQTDRVIRSIAIPSMLKIGSSLARHRISSFLGEPRHYAKPTQYDEQSSSPTTPLLRTTRNRHFDLSEVERASALAAPAEKSASLPSPPPAQTALLSLLLLVLLHPQKTIVILSAAKNRLLHLSLPLPVLASPTTRHCHSERSKEPAFALVFACSCL